MIQIYRADNRNYAANGDMVLFPEKCLLDAELNGTWELELKHPLDPEGRWRYLEAGAVLCVPSFLSKNQRFRIYQVNKTDNGITVNARPIFMDTGYQHILMDVHLTKISGKEALNKMAAGSGMQVKSDIEKISSSSYIRKNLMEAIAGNDENSFLNCWGGEILFDNETIVINHQVGKDQGVRVEFGKNLEGISEEIDFDDVITRIIPVSYKDYTLGGRQPWVDSPRINLYPVVFTKEVTFQDVKRKEDAKEDEDSFATLAELWAELKRRCSLMFQDGCDLPRCTYKVNMIDLSGTEEYKKYGALERISLGDTVYCSHIGLGITTKARVIQLVYNCVTESVEEATLGDFARNYFNEVTTAINRVEGIMNSDGTVRGERIAGIINAMNAKLTAQQNHIQKQPVRAILFEDLDPDSPTYGAMALGTAGFEIANQRNLGDSDWEWSTFGTGEGFRADNIIAGILASKNYEEGKRGVCFDLEKGTLNSANFCLKTSYTAEDGTVYQLFMQSPKEDDDIVFACNKLVDGGTRFTPSFFIRADGYIQSNDFHMVGGSIVVNTNSTENSIITINHESTKTSMFPGRVYVENEQGWQVGMAMVISGEGAAVQITKDKEEQVNCYSDEDQSIISAKKGDMESYLLSNGDTANVVAMAGTNKVSLISNELNPRIQMSTGMNSAVLDFDQFYKISHL